MGESALTSHLKGKKHADNCKASGRRSTNIRDFMKPNQGKSTAGAEAAVGSSTARSSTLETFVTREQTLKAEILWSLKVIDSHYRYRSCAGNDKLFQEMFPDSQIAKEFTCGEKKCAYLVCFGLAPHFKQMLIDSMKEEENYIIMFDESLNAVTNSKQMDIHVRAWNRCSNQVESRYYTSVFMGHGTADDMLTHFHEGMQGLHLQKIFQVSMDGPNVNWKFYRTLCDEIKKDFACQTFNIGSCGLHILHGGFKDGASASGWQIEKLFSSLHWLFHDTPARREDFTKVTGSSVFPLQFCKHRWLENLPVAERVQSMWENILKYVEQATAKKIPCPQTTSFEIVKQSTKDPLIEAKVAAFLSISKEVHPFLVRYQTDKPMIPFLATDLHELLKGLTKRFLKKEVHSDVNQILKLIKMDVKDSSTHCPVGDVDIGFTPQRKVKALVSTNKISARQALEFKSEYKQFLMKIVLKLLEKSPIQYQLARCAVCLDPRRMVSQQTDCQIKFKRILEHFVAANRLKDDECDAIIREYGNFLEAVKASPSAYKEFDPHKDSMRIDTFLFNKMGSNDDYFRLWQRVVCKVLLLSHSQASVERGFSFNKQLEVENLQERSFISQRHVIDHIKSVGGTLSVLVDRKLLMSAAGARQRYLAHLEDEKRKKEKETRVLKRKVADERIKELEKKKARLEDDMKAMQTSADDFAEKAENTGKLTWIAKSNSLRRSAKAKANEVQELVDEIASLKRKD
ncbi:hypothetical protein HOLleu_11110 [Holothuria leucospilota]|uniref:Uncharacterized protein n=1 Tax=Holothuria leucospilota TaxID=206669 RepID=A0A9Q1CF78_HOLLE|nr:hypothetical protein HOLleu_11110 [Holothuria leucospilota]